MLFCLFFEGITPQDSGKMGGTDSHLELRWVYDQVAGAEAGAIYYSLVETCKHHGIDPYLWMRYTLNRIPLATTPEELAALLPYHCDPNVLKQDLEQDRQNVLSKRYELTTTDKE